MRKIPPVVKTLLIINGSMLLITYLFAFVGIDLLNVLGLHYFKSEYFRPYQFITHMFMHAGLLHLFFNMYALWLFGSVLESVWGSKRFFWYYMITGFGAAILHTAVVWYQLHNFVAVAQQFLSDPNYYNFKYLLGRYPQYFNISAAQQLLDQWSLQPESHVYANEVIAVIRKIYETKINTPIVGASGAVFGVLLAFGLLFPDTPLFLFFIPVPIKAKYFVLGYGALELINGISNIPGDNIAHFAHLGGMIFGYILLKIWYKDRIKLF